MSTPTSFAPSRDEPVSSFTLCRTRFMLLADGPRCRYQRTLPVRFSSGLETHLW